MKFVCFSAQNCQQDVACDVFNAYIKPRSSPVRLHLTQKMIAAMDQFIQRNEVSAVSSSCV